MMLELDNNPNRCIDCSKLVTKLSRTNRCTMCGIKMGQVKAEKHKLIFSFFNDLSMDQTVRIIEFLKYQHNILNF